ncbi:brachyurin-like [Mercenaria mercenaria]|uniref:brachyurin-like n=1 Tax=Mercenaria mercenaria TaxID=6596 RepID=UPI001E1D92A5|nr:brachyurin-like [Mercenaria mercenaria]
MFGTVILALLSCGLVSGDFMSRIINGQATDTTAHPHQLSLEYQGNHVCGASIIGTKWAVTAAHCVEFANYNETLFGVAVNNGKRSDPDRAVYPIKKITPHGSYTGTAGFLEAAYANDIALLELFEEITSWADKAIELSTDILDNKNCTITGWGLDSTDTSPDVLQETTGTILTESGCVSKWNTILQPAYSHQYHVCIDDPNTGSCNGDSGGPMVCDGKLAGVTSWGASGCDTTKPSVYVRVPNYVTWIQGYTNPTPTFL